MTTLLNNLSIRTKLIGAFAAVLAATAGLGLFAIDRLASVNEVATRIREDYLQSVRYLGELSTQTERFRLKRAYIILSTDPDERARFEEELKSNEAARAKAWEAYRATIDPGPEQDLAAAVDRDWKTYMADGQALRDAVAAGRVQEAAKLFLAGALRADFDKERADIEKDLAFKVEAGNRAAEESAAVYRSARMAIFLVLGLATGLAVLAGWLLTGTVSLPIRRMTDAMARLADRRLDTEIEGIGRRDELGRMAGAVQVFKEGLIEAERLALDQRQEQERKEARARLIDGYVASFGGQVAQSLDALASAATEMNATAASMSSVAEDTSRRVTMVSAASQQTSANVQTVASASEEMTASIDEITHQVAQANLVVRSAVEEADTTRGTMQRLSDAAQKIGDVVTLISDIASQTNLLALNATIEAARAGEAGKGFAVVASEVKALASQTAKATGEIATQISAIQDATQHATTAIGGIGDTIGRISEISSVIAAAVEEQGATTREISRNTQQAASGTDEVARNIIGVNDAASHTGVAAAQVLAASGELGRQSETLRAEVTRFLADLQAA